MKKRLGGQDHVVQLGAGTAAAVGVAQVFQEPGDSSKRTFFSEIISSISDIKFSQDGRCRPIAVLAAPMALSRCASRCVGTETTLVSTQINQR